ncbi:hypothetical protein DDE74_09105 [Streptomyces lydicus]|uniref:Uncharacterized protein n=1 Tax=Streptomyces lydicus TaxID=47763 RepID=A0A3S9Y7S4_9ACTN|nr:hypothetical protein DDE74_09105 [Streptomyces lydicus]
MEDGRAEAEGREGGAGRPGAGVPLRPGGWGAGILGAGRWKQRSGLDERTGRSEGTGWTGRIGRAG